MQARVRIWWPWPQEAGQSDQGDQGVQPPCTVGRGDGKKSPSFAGWSNTADLPPELCVHPDVNQRVKPERAATHDHPSVFVLSLIHI